MAFSLQVPRFKKDYKHTAKDWLGLAIIGAAAIIAALFIVTQLTHYLEGMALEQFANQLDSAQVRYDYAKAHSTSTPEKTYDAFRQALLNNDLDGALKWIAPSADKRYVGWIRQDYKEGRFQAMVKNFTPIKEVWSTEDAAYYEYVTPPPTPLGQLGATMDSVSFQRDIDGLWKITSI